MGSTYYKIPLRLAEVIKGNELPVCDLEQSISNNLGLILVTHFGEHRSDPRFGCEIWELDFEVIVTASIWEEKLRQSLLKSIAAYEPRLSDVQISLSIADIEKQNYFKQFTEIKKRVNIMLSGTIRATGEPFQFRTNMFLSPLSLD